MDWSYHAIRLRVVFGFFIGLGLCMRAFASPADIALAQLHHTQWNVQDGAPSGITDIVQTRDGYVWLVGTGRLFRFDGVEFERIQHVGGLPLPTERIYTIWTQPGGGLWISYLFGGATFIDDGTVRNYSQNEGLPRNTALSFAEDASARMWLGTSVGLLYLEGGRWTFAEESWQMPRTAIEAMALDHDGTLWVQTGDALYFQRRGMRRFELGLQARSQGDWIAGLVKLPDGSVWFARAGAGLTELKLPAVGAMVVPKWHPAGFDSPDALPLILIDRHSNLWLSIWGSVTRTPLTRGKRLAAHEPAAEPPGKVRLAGGLSGGMLEDREGNIWAGSQGGLDKFRESAFVSAAPGTASYGTAALAATDDGSVWVSAYSGSLHRFQGGLERESVQSPHKAFDVLHRDHAGVLWVGGESSSIFHRRGDKWIQWRPEETYNAGGVQAIVSQPDGTLWVSILRVGVYRVIDNQWTLWGGLTDLPREPATMLALDASDRLWLGYGNNRLAMVNEGRVVVYDSTAGLSTGAVQVATVRGRNIWIGGEKGLNWFDGRRFHPVQGEQAHTFGHVSGIIEKSHGDLWLSTSEGAVLVAAAEVRNFVATPGTTVRFRLFNHLDGMTGAAATLGPWPTAVEATDGRMWFTTTNGVVSIGPDLPPANLIVPSVFLKSITVDGNRIDLEAPRDTALRLPPSPHVLRISYTAPSLAIPERVNFRYRLEGSEMGWEDVGGRRDAYFTGLAPGSYRFQVIASNDSGVWNESGASLDFVVPPTFLQSRAFIAICIVAASVALWLLFTFRLRRVKSRLESRSEARLMERERIARDLHDTFLQGVHGLMLRFQFATDRIPEDAPAKLLMEDALDRADRVLADGREKLFDLRAPVRLHLSPALGISGRELARDYGGSFHVEVEGTLRELDPQMEEEVYRIGVEAIANAFRHARPGRVCATLTFGRRCFDLRVVDDGLGFDESTARVGSWGLKGMRERAQRIGAKITISSEPGAGTTVELHIPARLAYRKEAIQRPMWRRLGQAFRRNPNDC